MVEIDDDVAGIASGLAAIDHRIRLRYSETGEYFVVYLKPDEWEEGDGYMVFTAQELDGRIVKHMEEVYIRCNARGYSLADEAERQEAKAKKNAAHEFTEKHGEMYERLAHAMRKDLGYDQSKIYVPESVS